MNSKKNLITVILFSILASTGVAFAQEATDPAEKIRQEVTRIVQDQEEPEQKKAFSGEITDIFNKTIVLETRDGKKTVKVEQKGLIISNNKEIDFEDLEIGSWVIAMGYLTETELLSAKRIVVSTKPDKQEKEALMGTIIEAEDKRLIIKTTADNEPAIIVYDETTAIFDYAGDDLELEKGQVIVAAGTAIAELKINAGTIRIILAPEPFEDSFESTGSAEQEQIDKYLTIL